MQGRRETPGREPIHVLISAYACEPHKGSAQALGWNWARHLSQACRVTVLTRSNSQQPIEDWIEKHELHLPNVSFHYLDAPQVISRIKRGQRGLTAYYVAWQWRALSAAAEIYARDPFDLAHHVTFESIHSPIFLQRLPTPLIYGPVGGGEYAPREFWEGGGPAAYLYDAARAAHAEMARCDPLLQATLRGAARILTATPQTERLVPAAHRAKTSVLSPVGIESELVVKTPPQIGQGRKIYSIGRLVHWKGIDLAIRAFARVARRYPDASLTVLGDGPQRKNLEILAADEGVAHQVHLQAHVPRSEVIRLADESDIFLLPSLHDTGGVALVEAMARAKPVVVLDTGGPSVVVTDECGIKVPATNPDAAVNDLADGLEHLMQQPELRARMGLAARERIIREFVWERKTERMLRIYDDVLTSAAHPALRRA